MAVFFHYCMNDPFLWLTPNQWSAVSAIGTLLAAFFTLYAVHVSLRLSRRNDPKLSITASLFIAPHTCILFKEGENLLLRVINQSPAPFSVMSFQWGLGKNISHSFDADIFTNLIYPFRLDHGDIVEGYMHFETMREEVRQIGNKLSSKRLPFGQLVRHIYLGVNTSFGHFWCRLDGELLHVFLNAFEGGLDEGRRNKLSS